MKRIVEVADLVVSDDPQQTLITYALGSCLGITAYDSAAQVGGLLHCQLPMAPRDPLSTISNSLINPAQFADTGLMALLLGCLDLGAERSRLRLFVAGGAAVMKTLSSFQIAERNCWIVRKLLDKNELVASSFDVGGRLPRTMSLRLSDGAVHLQIARKRWKVAAAATNPQYEVLQ